MEVSRSFEKLRLQSRGTSQVISESPTCKSVVRVGCQIRQLLRIPGLQPGGWGKRAHACASRAISESPTCKSVVGESEHMHASEPGVWLQVCGSARAAELSGARLRRVGSSRQGAVAAGLDRPLIYII